MLVIDEAQNLSADVLEQLRLLTNLETSERKLLQIILIGQPELRTMLARPELEQLAQRVIARYHLGSLTEAETGSYIAHRLAVAGAGAATPFPRALIGAIHRLTNGVPRRINLLCDRALLGAYVENTSEVTRAILRKAADEVFGEQARPRGAARRVAAGRGRRAGRRRDQRRRRVAGAAAARRAAPAPRRPAAPRQARRRRRRRRAAPRRPRRRPTPAPPTRCANWPACGARRCAAGEPCQAALKLNLHCHQGKGGLYELRLLDRPAILTLHDGQQVGYAVLTALDDNTATLRVDGKSQTLGVAAIAARFDGEYTTFWTAPRGFREQVAAGEQRPGRGLDRGAAGAVERRRGAARWTSRSTARMQKLLREFQAKQNLKADGVTGPRTYMRLSQLGGVDEPRLLAAKGQGK